MFFLTWFSHILYRPISSWVLGGRRGGAVFIHCYLLFGTTEDASCLSHLKNALTSTKLQSQVPECLAKPFPPLPWWDVLTPTPPSSLHVSVALPRCRSGMWLISSSLHELRHPFFRVLQEFFCTRQITSTPQLSYLVLNPLFNS